MFPMGSRFIAQNRNGTKDSNPKTQQTAEAYVSITILIYHSNRNNSFWPATWLLPFLSYIFWRNLWQICVAWYCITCIKLTEVCTRRIVSGILQVTWTTQAEVAKLCKALVTSRVPQITSSKFMPFVRHYCHTFFTWTKSSHSEQRCKNNIGNLLTTLNKLGELQ